MSRRIAMATLSLALALALALVLAALGQTLPQGVRQMASMGGITEYDLPNGLKRAAVSGCGAAENHRERDVSGGLAA